MLLRRRGALETTQRSGEGILHVEEHGDDPVRISSQIIAEHSSIPTSNLNEILSKLVDLQMSHNAPDIDIDIFSGNPLEYCYFRATFRDVVEKSYQSSWQTDTNVKIHQG